MCWTPILPSGSVHLSLQWLQRDIRMTTLQILMWERQATGFGLHWTCQGWRQAPLSERCCQVWDASRKCFVLSRFFYDTLQPALYIEALQVKRKTAYKACSIICWNTPVLLCFSTHHNLWDFQSFWIERRPSFLIIIILVFSLWHKQ